MNPEIHKAFQVCVGLVTTKKADGFFWPGEFGSTGKQSETKKFILYTAPGGVLHLLKGRHTMYGYKTEEDLAADCRKGRLKAKTVTGALTLGSLRMTQTAHNLVVSVFPRGCAGKLLYRAESDEEAEGMAKMLRPRFRKSKITITHGSISELFADVPPLTAIKAGLFSVLGGSDRFTFFLLASLMACTLLLLTDAWLYHRPFMFQAAIGVTAIFVWVVGVSSGKWRVRRGKTAK